MKEKIIQRSYPIKLLSKLTPLFIKEMKPRHFTTVVFVFLSEKMQIVAKRRKHLKTLKIYFGHVWGGHSTQNLVKIHSTLCPDPYDLV